VKIQKIETLQLFAIMCLGEGHIELKWKNIFLLYFYLSLLWNEVFPLRYVILIDTTFWYVLLGRFQSVNRSRVDVFKNFRVRARVLKQEWKLSQSLKNVTMLISDVQQTRNKHWTRLGLDCIWTITNFFGVGLDPDCKSFKIFRIRTGFGLI